MQNNNKKKVDPVGPVCPCCNHRLPSHDRDDFASTFRIWAHAHRIALDMNGHAKNEALAMMIRWERMFRTMHPMPTDEELKLATDYMLQTRDNASAPWNLHYAILKNFILRRRDQEAKTRRLTETKEPVADAARAERARSLLQEFNERTKPPQESTGNASSCELNNELAKAIQEKQ